MSNGAEIISWARVLLQKEINDMLGVTEERKKAKERKRQYDKEKQQREKEAKERAAHNDMVIRNYNLRKRPSNTDEPGGPTFPFG